jgi:hypothetical protein
VPDCGTQGKDVVMLKAQVIKTQTIKTQVLS